MDVLILAAALWFGYEALKAALTAMQTAKPAIALFVYCLICALLIAYVGGWLHLPGHSSAQAATITHCFNCETASTIAVQEF